MWPSELLSWTPPVGSGRAGGVPGRGGRRHWAIGTAGGVCCNAVAVRDVPSCQRYPRPHPRLCAVFGRLCWTAGRAWKWLTGAKPGTWNPGFELSGFLARAEKERAGTCSTNFDPLHRTAWCRPGHVFPRSFACAGFIEGFPTRPNTSTRRVKRVLSSEGMRRRPSTENMAYRSALQSLIGSILPMKTPKTINWPMSCALYFMEGVPLLYPAVEHALLLHNSSVVQYRQSIFVPSQVSSCPKPSNSSRPRRTVAIATAAPSSSKSRLPRSSR